ncbi:hypothetical protein EGR_08774 [Echinococcus granulosus]|uniref:Uncharacterized protein n=1 Tax=Echinococcus granulosus TaxID=6210 RepID=W6U5A0_ECHGR|nr:hypothetical protein EGR_08774 [Echinococcus granulosus]EUB56348.1 hypothetical protein EGR_08774 [Echinococcus granulosus]
MCRRLPQLIQMLSDNVDDKFTFVVLRLSKPRDVKMTSLYGIHQARLEPPPSSGGQLGLPPGLKTSTSKSPFPTILIGSAEEAFSFGPSGVNLWATNRGAVLTLNNAHEDDEHPPLNRSLSIRVASISIQSCDTSHWSLFPL